MDGDIRTSRGVAYVLGQFFFPALWTRTAGLDDDSRHRYRYRNGNAISCAVTLVVHPSGQNRRQQHPDPGASYCRAIAMRIASSGETR